MDIIEPKKRKKRIVLVFVSVIITVVAIITLGKMFLNSLDMYYEGFYSSPEMAMEQNTFVQAFEVVDIDSSIFDSLQARHIENIPFDSTSIWIANMTYSKPKYVFFREFRITDSLMLAISKPKIYNTETNRQVRYGIYTPGYGANWKARFTGVGGVSVIPINPSILEADTVIAIVWIGDDDIGEIKLVKKKK